MKTNTEKYEWSHGHKPRGFGNWFFEVQGQKGSGWTFETIAAFGKFSEARAEAVRRFTDGFAVSNVTVTVLP